jgi:HPt (histidine-containing phosphotransfer) domain-containing protein
MTDLILDVSVLEELNEYGHNGGEPEILNDLLKIFYDTTPKRLDGLITAAGQGDAQALHLIAHSLKSSCAYLGARRMQSMCLKLEKLSQLNETAGTGSLVQAIIAEYTLVKSEMERAAAQLNLH